MRARQDGFVSMLATIIISLLLIIITTSMVSLEILQLRKAQDSEQSTRAFYAAEAGVEDAVAQVLTDPTAMTTQDCTDVASKNVTYDVNGVAGWTCQQIAFSGSPEGTLKDPDKAKTVDPGHVGGGGYQSVVIEWNQSASASSYDLVGALPAQASYNLGAPPLEVAVVSYPNSNISASDVCDGAADVGCSVRLQNVLFVPGGTGASGIASFGSFSGGGPRDANCESLQTRGEYTIAGRTSYGYNCYAIISGLPAARDHLFRLKSRYSGTTYRMTFMSGDNGSGSPVSVSDGTATIDVTAKAGDAYRRVITKLPINASAASGLDYVIYSDTDVCKNFDVINGGFPGGPGC